MKIPLLALALSLALVGCGKKQDEPAGAGAAGGGDRCTVAIGKAIDAMIAKSSSAGAPEQMIEIANKLRTTLVTRCQADSWAQPVLDCFASASDQPSIRNCRTQLPPDQAQRIQAEIIQAMTGGAGPARGMPAGHGGAPPAGAGE